MTNFVLIAVILCVLIVTALVVRRRVQGGRDASGSQSQSSTSIATLMNDLEHSVTAGNLDEMTDRALDVLNSDLLTGTMALRAVEVLRKAAEGGLPRAQLHLGLCYDSGQGVTKDYQQARTWIQRAADQGYQEAKLAIAILNGETV